jgi:endogenous inhibitor of DNA gyrase (YacG/DUF329 family)
MSKKTCPECGGKYESGAHDARFCSRQCQVAALNRKPERTYAGRKAAARG